MHKKPLVIFEMANNHGGNVNRGLEIIRAYAVLAKPYRDKLDFAFKLQYRDLDTFVHPEFQTRTDIKLIKRFKETELTEDEFLQLRHEMDVQNFIPICTPFDEVSVQKVKNHNYQYIKIASCSLDDWPLLEEIGKTGLPVIASIAGAVLETIDCVVTFFQHRKQPISLMHCVGLYPTSILDLQLNRLDILRNRYPDIPIGLSSHECPDSNLGTLLAIAKGATIIERHIGIDNLNTYSLGLDAAQEWLTNICNALHACHHTHLNDHEIQNLHDLKRGIYAKKDIKVGDILNKDNIFFAMPTHSLQHLTANHFSKYSELRADREIQTCEPILKDQVTITRCHNQLLSNIAIVHKMLQDAHIAIPNNTTVELSHHYGLSNFAKLGMVIINCINREYCKKYLILLPGQTHPEQYHKLKEETFHVIYGNVDIKLDGMTFTSTPGQVVVVEREVRHQMYSEHGAIIEEISTEHINNDSYYTDSTISSNLNRKTELKYFFG